MIPPYETATHSTKLSRRRRASATSLAQPQQDGPQLDAVQIARRHRMIKRGPTPDFFEGMLLGNGDVGLCVTVRPDALGLHLGKEDSWDSGQRRPLQVHPPFQGPAETLERASAEAKRQGKPEMLFLERNIDFFREYTEKVGSSYRKVWPRPCLAESCGYTGTRACRGRAAVARHRQRFADIDLDYDNLRGARRSVRVNCFVNYDDGHVRLDGHRSALPVSCLLSKHRSAGAVPPVELEVRQKAGFGEFTSYQHFPATAPTPEVPNPHAATRTATSSWWEECRAIGLPKNLLATGPFCAPANRRHSGLDWSSRHRVTIPRTAATA